MYYSGESNVPGAPGNLMAAGIPVGQDPRFPMSQSAFEYQVDKRRMDRMSPQQNQRFMDDFRRIYSDKLRGASLPGMQGVPMGNAGATFYAGPQYGQPPVGFDGKYVS